jgi:predicted alpha/beta-fold hydrolase
MPILDPNTYKPAPLLRYGHLSTILPNILRKIKRPPYERFRLDTDDGDFLDLDLSKVGSDTLVILTHGLEGSSDREYMSAMVNEVNANNWDALAINLRGCSGVPNKLYSSYHSGKSDDLNSVVNHVLAYYAYKSILLIGYSLGGNITLKYVGEKDDEIHPSIKGAAAVSVPIMLKDSAYKLAKQENWIYMNRFVRKLSPKLKEKIIRFPQNGLSTKVINKMKTFYDFDSLYTAPAHGFSSAEDYWAKSSSRPFIKNIQVPTLLINAKDDPFLAENCFPFEEAESNPYFYLLAPEHGGHVGFMSSIWEKGSFWHEKEMITFFRSKI